MPVAARAEAVYDIVSDVTRMGEWSPECYRCEWLDGTTGPAPGARFQGWNRRGSAKWSMKCRVAAAEPGRRFAFVTTRMGVRSTRWEYVFEPAAQDACVVTESFTIPGSFAFVMAPVNRFWLGVRDRQADLIESMTTTLERIKTAAEGGSGARA